MGSLCCKTGGDWAAGAAHSGIHEPLVFVSVFVVVVTVAVFERLLRKQCGMYPNGSCKTWHEWNLTHIFLNWFKWHAMETSPRLFALNGVSVGPHLLQASTLEEMATIWEGEMMFFQVCIILVSHGFPKDFLPLCVDFVYQPNRWMICVAWCRWCILCWVLIQCVSKQWTHLAPWKFKVSRGWFRWKVPKVVSPRLRWGTVAMIDWSSDFQYLPKMMEFYCEGVWAREKTKGWVSWIDCLSNDESEIFSLFLAKSFVSGKIFRQHPRSWFLTNSWDLGSTESEAWEMCRMIRMMARVLPNRCKTLEVFVSYAAIGSSLQGSHQYVVVSSALARLFWYDDGCPGTARCCSGRHGRRSPHGC